MISSSAETPADILKKFRTSSLNSIDLTLDRIEVALAQLGNPHHSLPPIIHIAGTNGKGSTCAFLKAMTDAAGLTAHMFTSPHLVKHNECIRVQGAMISDEEFIVRLQEIERKIGFNSLSEFEALTTVAFLAFSESPADLVILETGMGGRGDATNVISLPAISVITPISFDHERFLGSTLGSIAWHKAGIIKTGRPTLVAEQESLAMDVIVKEAKDKNSNLHLLQSKFLKKIPLSLTLKGDHQIRNAALAAQALALWKNDAITDEVISRGAQEAFWPARMQRLQSGQVTELAEGKEVWLDGAHNPHAANTIAQILDSMPGETILISAMMAGKDHEATFLAYSGIARRVLTCPNADGYANASPQTLARAAEKVGLKAKAFPSFMAAMTEAGKLDTKRILICGSLRLAGLVLEANGESPIYSKTD